MAKFFLGQRVKKVRGELDIGNTGRVTGLDALCPFGWDILVVWDHAGPCDDGSIAPAGEDAWTRSECLEPIQPSGHRAGDYSLSDLLDRCRAGEGVAA